MWGPPTPYQFHNADTYTHDNLSAVKLDLHDLRKSDSPLGTPFILRTLLGDWTDCFYSVCPLFDYSSLNWRWV